jgi:1-acyl-sn-glycerol-3-phosphate acyltransferase
VGALRSLGGHLGYADQVGGGIRARVERLDLPWNAYGSDPYGTSKSDLQWFFTAASLLYRHYFRVRAVGTEHVPAQGRAMLVGNHSGGIALDALMVIAAIFLEKEPPRLAQAMAEKFLAGTPFASRLSSRLGHLTGLPEHVERLLADERLLLVFPEGARGTAKLFWERDSLVQFGTGFMRLALRTRTPIIPFGFVGGGEAIPTLVNSYALGRLLGTPYVPFTPWLAPLPLPARLRVHFGPAMTFAGSGSEDDATIEHKVDEVKGRIAELIAQARGVELKRLRET